MKSSVLFINMPIRENAPPNNVPLGLLVLSSYLNRNGYHAEILDLNVHRPRKSHVYDDLRKVMRKVYKEGSNTTDNARAVAETRDWSNVAMEVLKEIRRYG